MVAKASAISVAAGGRFALAAACSSTGISRVSAATLFMKADSAAPTPPITEIWAEMERP